MTLRLHVLASGHADTLVLELPSGRLAVVDFGHHTLLDYLAHLDPAGTRRFAFCLLTHAHKDHYLCLKEFIDRYDSRVDEYWFSISNAGMIRDRGTASSVGAVYRPSRDLPPLTLADAAWSRQDDCYCCASDTGTGTAQIDAHPGARGAARCTLFRLTNTRVRPRRTRDSHDRAHPHLPGRLYLGLAGACLGPIP